MSVLLRSTQPFHWNAVSDGKAAGLEPGDIFFFSDDSLTMQAARVLPPLVWLVSGAIVIDSRTYSPSSVSISTEVDADAPEGNSDSWEAAAPVLGSARIGSITDGNYVDIDGNGHLTLIGDATVYEDFQVAPGDAGRLGFSDPGWVKVKDNGAGSTGVYALGFDSNLDQEVFFSIELPHSWEEGDGICPHVHWIPPDATGGDEGVTWGLEYSWANEGVINGSGSPVVFGNTTIILAPDVDTFTADEHRVIDFAEIDGSGKLISSVVLCRLFRDVSDGDDDYGSDAILVNIDIHFKRDSLGSQTERSKT
jgi:hypothetical protein